MFGDGPVGAGQEQPEVGPVGHRRPHLLPVHDPVVSGPLGPGGHCGEVGPRARLAEQLAPDLPAGEGGPEKPVLLLVGPEGGESGGHHGHTDQVDRLVPRRAGLSQPFVDDVLEARVHAETTPAGREFDPGQPELELGGPEGRRR